MFDKVHRLWLFALKNTEQADGAHNYEGPGDCAAAWELQDKLSAVTASPCELVHFVCITALMLCVELFISKEARAVLSFLELCGQNVPLKLNVTLQ